MTEKIKDIVTQIDREIRKEKSFDFHVISYDGCRLTIAGSTDLTYYHKLEIIFDDVFFVSGVFGGWHSDTERVVFSLPDNEKDLNQKFEIEQGYELFIFKADDYKNDFIIAAKTLSFNTDTVFYYDRRDLKENERIS
ncbi:hypothetical protein [Limnovirga soli]|uniref:Uncharacterized protein n=1 Tax=Limnovirga soli TaxID=2656915 RepID=A0A8J8FK61_9BACT|nr:hypothetical protein [Limnovirga soli]NNV57824.1 hypothetical protein [Limnovirga soli]